MDHQLMLEQLADAIRKYGTLAVTQSELELRAIEAARDQLQSVKHIVIATHTDGEGFEYECMYVDGVRVSEEFEALVSGTEIAEQAGEALARIERVQFQTCDRWPDHLEDLKPAQEQTR